MSVPLDWAPG